MSVATGLIRNETTMSASSVSALLISMLKEATTPLANPANAPRSSCSWPLRSWCWTAHEVWR